MDPTVARNRLQRMVAYDSRPSLTTAEVDDLVIIAKVADSEGRAITDAAWVPTYDLNKAAAEGWRWKAGKVAAKFRVQGGGQALARDQVHRHCMRMIEVYENKAEVSGAGVQNIRSPGNLVVDRGSAPFYPVVN